MQIEDLADEIEHLGRRLARRIREKTGEPVGFLIIDIADVCARAARASLTVDATGPCGVMRIEASRVYLVTDTDCAPGILPPSRGV